MTSVPCGWRPTAWVAELRRLAGCCEDLNPARAAELRSWAAAVEAANGAAEATATGCRVPGTIAEAVAANALYARRSDPPTSVAAAAAVRPAIPGLVRWAAECVRAMPGATARELAARYAPCDPPRIHRRLAEAESAGLIRRAGPRRCRVTGHTAETWEPVSC